MFVDDDESMSYLNGWEENIPNLSILQSFHKKSRKQTGGDKQFAAFNYGEVSYICSSMEIYSHE